MKITQYLLISSLIVLPGCMDNKDKAVEKKSGTILLSINGKPAIYESDYETFYNDFLNMRQDLQSYLAINPAVKDEIRRGIFDELVYQNIFTEWVKGNKIDQTAEYKKNRDKAYEMIDRKLAIEAFQQEVMKNTSISDDEAQKYYEDNKDKVGYFRQAPFISVAGGIDSEGIVFETEKAAKDFFAKLKQAGSKFVNLAKEAKKSITNFGPISAQSQDVDVNIKRDVLSSKDIPNVIVVKGNDKKFWVISLKDKKEAVYAPFEQVKEAVKEVVQQVKLPEIFKSKIDDVKKTLSVIENRDFFVTKPLEQAPVVQDQVDGSQVVEQAQAAQSNGGGL